MGRVSRTVSELKVRLKKLIFLGAAANVTMDLNGLDADDIQYLQENNTSDVEMDEEEGDVEANAEEEDEQQEEEEEEEDDEDEEEEEAEEEEEEEWVVKKTPYCGEKTPSKVPAGQRPKQPERQSNIQGFKWPCVICKAKFKDTRAVMTHFSACVKKNGNPHGFHWWDGRGIDKDILPRCCRVRRTSNKKGGRKG